MNRTYFKIALVIYLIAILVVSTIPGHTLKDVNWLGYDKLNHIIMYAIFAFLAVNSMRFLSFWPITIMIIIGFVYGGFNELWQGLVADRYPSFYDALANGIGLIIGSIISVRYLVFARDK